jgi:hypothetical protein
MKKKVQPQKPAIPRIANFDDFAMELAALMNKHGVVVAAYEEQADGQQVLKKKRMTFLMIDEKDAAMGIPRPRVQILSQDLISGRLVSAAQEEVANVKIEMSVKK